MSRNENDRKIGKGRIFSSGDIVFMILFALLLIFLVWLKSYVVSRTPADHESTEYPKQYLVDVRKAAAKYGIEEERIFAVIKVESDFNPLSRSKSDARGLMQMLPSTYQDVCERRGEKFDPERLYDPSVNIDACTYYLAWLYERLGNWNNVHIAYNAGIGNVNKWLQDPQYTKDGVIFNTPKAQANAYIKRINYYYDKYKNCD